MPPSSSETACLRVGVLVAIRGADATVKTAGGVVVVESSGVGEALDGDHVRVEMLGRRVGRVVAVLARSPRRLVGVVYAGRWFVCDDERLPRALRLDPSAIDEDTLVGVELVPSVTSGAAEARVVQVFGARGTERAETEAFLWLDATADDERPA